MADEDGQPPLWLPTAEGVFRDEAILRPSGDKKEKKAILGC
ncbi:hypothetical protein [Methanocaldococcus infernus]|nr:hypothetical protein [Methanocaldococcus infernus]